MAYTGLLKLFIGKPVHPVGDDGRMALSDHLRELRARILKAAFVLLVGFIVALFFFDPIFAVINDPYQKAREALGAERTMATTSGVAGGFILYLKLCGLTAVVGTSPIWLYQIWAFILPGLHANEKRWTILFALIAGPLFLGGIALGYFTLPKGLEILIGFTQADLTNLVEFNDYLSFFTRTLLVFGIAFEIPVFVVLLNMAGVVKGKALGAARPWIVIGTFIFAAAATPSTDPFTMTFMAVPMIVLFLVSEVIARLNDRRRARKAINAGLSPDEASPLEL
ncbi:MULTISPECIES: twin-arginine translocase subunit TatC [unclassified Nocardioides]|uniref:twin-arginine translocase subunit TatC n=1 Tax=unclassified Nocardioides TaxID=2615069 RepID=UPI001152EE0A|nr:MULTISPECIES: twin-arginine translocase subunit TatC [unclassified Nocardioides]TQK71118.1 sec-independent protein translocase protein TatC [Nocardioides sp. SLBN-35]WGY04700.1 twin-arginine translocase subunit TatC [Nocardioides sp. QY071]